MATTTFRGLEVLISRQQIAERVAEMGEQITRDLKGEKLVMIGVLKGAAPFLADLARAIDADATFDFIAVKSYPKGSQTSSGAVQVIKDLDESIEGKNVLIVEDILDTGLTLAYLRKLFLQQHPKSLRIATLLDKPSRRIEKIEADYVGFAVPNLFVIGYGMDFAERYRNLPDICLMPPDQPAWEVQERILDEHDMLRAAYRDFNARRIEAVLGRMIPDVMWANGMEGGYVHGVDAVREYWQRQFAILSPHVEPISIDRDADGRYVVRVHQTVRDLEGKLLLDTEVRHFYTIYGGFIERMDIGS